MKRTFSGNLNHHPLGGKLDSGVEVSHNERQSPAVSSGKSIVQSIHADINAEILLRRGFLLASLSVLAGCAAWTQPPESAARSRLRNNSSVTSNRKLIISVAIVEYRDHELAMVERVWKEVDQQAIDIDTRRVLDSNGLRAGVLSSHTSSGMGEFLDKELPQIADALPGLIEAFDDESLPTRSRIKGMQMQFQPGVMREVPVSGTYSLVDWTIVNRDRVTPGYAANSQGSVQILASEVDDSGVTIELTPGFREASSQPIFGTGKNDFEFSSHQVFHSLPDLLMRTRLRRGQSILVGGTHVKTASQHGTPSAGDLFFGDNRETDHTGLRRLLWIRLDSIPVRY